MLVAGSPAPSARADGAGTGLVVDVNGVDVPNVAQTLEGIPHDFVSATYTEVFPGGSTVQIHAFNGWYLQTLIRAVGADPSTTAQVLVDRPLLDGSVTLTPPDYAPGGTDFPEGPAIVWEHDPGEFFFFRPYRLPPPQDPNSNDYVQTPVGSDLTVHVTAGAELSVRVSRSVTHPVPGQAVGFRASVAGAEPGEHLSYEWQFADGFTSHGGPTVRHAFATPGTYSGTVTVSGSDGSGGSAVIHVVVGSVPGSPGPGNHHPGGGSQSGGSSGSHGGADGNGRTQGATGAGATRPKANPSPHAPAPPGTQISGFLVASTGSATTLASSPSEARGPSGTISAAGPGWIRGVSAGALVVGLFALGAFLESDHPRRRIVHRQLRRRARAGSRT